MIRGSCTVDLSGEREVTIMALHSSAVVFRARYSTIAVPVIPFPPVMKATFGAIVRIPKFLRTRQARGRTAYFVVPRCTVSLPRTAKAVGCALSRSGVLARPGRSSWLGISAVDLTHVSLSWRWRSAAYSCTGTMSCNNGRIPVHEPN